VAFGRFAAAFSLSAGVTLPVYFKSVDESGTAFASGSDLETASARPTTAAPAAATLTKVRRDIDLFAGELCRPNTRLLLVSFINSLIGAPAIAVLDLKKRLLEISSTFLSESGALDMKNFLYVIFLTVSILKYVTVK
jgi:hypothetical protein